MFLFRFQVAMAGDFIIGVTGMMIARCRNDSVTLTLSQVYHHILNMTIILINDFLFLFFFFASLEIAKTLHFFNVKHKSHYKNH